MEEKKKIAKTAESSLPAMSCETVAAEAGRLIDSARHVAVRTLNSIMVAGYWLIGQSVVELVKKGLELGLSDEEILRRIGEQLRARYGTGFSSENLHLMCRFYLAYSAVDVTSAAAKGGTQPAASAKSGLATLARRFPLSWSHYMQLIESAVTAETRSFYETEAQRHGWSAAELKRQISSRAYERANGLEFEPLPLAEPPAPPKAASEKEAAFDEILRDSCLLEFLGVVQGAEVNEAPVEAPKTPPLPLAEKALQKPLVRPKAVL